MYLHNIPAVNYADPWNVPLEQRLKTLEGGHQRVAYIYLLPDQFVFRYRAYNMVQALRESKDGTSAAYFTDLDLPAMDKVVDMADVIVICRTKYDQELNHIITRAHDKGKKVFFDVDDLVFDIKYIPLLLTSHDLDQNDPRRLDDWFAHIGRLSATMQLCDRAIVTNGYLAAELQPYFNKKIDVIPNFLNQEQMRISDQIYQQKKASGFARTKQIQLGYFSGTPSHNKDFNSIADALANILEYNPRVTIRITGPLDISGPLLNYSSQIEHFPLQDFINLQRLIGEVEGNLVPLQDNKFTNCKSELKYFEAGIVGTASIATPIYSYAHAIEDGKNGFLATTFEWYEKIDNLLEMIVHSKEIEMVENARQHSEQQYAWYKQTKLIESILFSETGSSTENTQGQEQVLQLQTKLERSENARKEENLSYAAAIQTARQRYNKLQKEMKEREQVLASLDAALAEIYSSRAWKMLDLYRRARLRLMPPGSRREMIAMLLKDVLVHPKGTFRRFARWAKQASAKPGIIRLQNELLAINYAKDTRKLIAFLVPGVDAVNGGIMSICSLAKVSQSLKSIHNSEILIATLPGNPLFTKYTHFENPFDIYRFNQLYSYFSGIEELTIHLPELYVPRFLARLNQAEMDFLKRIPKLKINIMAQNIWYMPSQEIIARIRQLAETVTCTTAHSKYCTQEMREYYGIPFHHFSASNLTDYYFLPYKDKENLMVVSNDEHKAKGKILTKLQSEHPELTIKIIENLSYEEYKRLLSRAKWAITFGEGLDGYFVESIRSGAIPFAVYNKDFFTDRFKDLPNVYLSYEEMYNDLSTDLEKLSSPQHFERLSQQLIDLDKQEYNDEEYKENIRRFYAGDYDLP